MEAGRRLDLFLYMQQLIDAFDFDQISSIF